MSTASGQTSHDTLFVGDPAPWFRQRCIGQAGLFSFDMMAGRFVAMCFYGAATDAAARAALALAHTHRTLFHGPGLCFFGISMDPADDTNPALAPSPGMRHFADSDAAISRAYGVAPRQGDRADVRRCWMVLDPHLRVVAVFPLDDTGNAAALRFLGTLPSPFAYGQNTHTPVLMIPMVFEPEFCARLIRCHAASNAADSGILTEGAALSDHGFKRRRDCRITDPALAAQAQTRIFRRVVPEIRHAFQFTATRLERLIIACYDAEEDGRFGPHRDNTVAATAHRRFAVSINLNEDFDGGGVTFPEYSPHAFKPPVGGALVFSCALMHEVVPMTRGRRYACLPFVYDDAAAALRRDNARKA